MTLLESTGSVRVLLDDLQLCTIQPCMFLTVCLCVNVGLDVINIMTSKQKSELLVDMEDFEGKKVFARYSSFKVDAECDGYKLTVTGFKNGGAGE